MTYLVTYPKTILVELATKLGLDPTPDLKIIHLKNLIESSDNYDEAFTKILAESLVAKKRAEEKKKQAEFEREEKKRQVEFEREEKKRQVEFEREEKKRQEEREDKRRREEREYELEVRRLEKERLRRKRQVYFEQRKREIEQEYKKWEEVFKWEPAKLKIAGAVKRRCLKKLEKEKALEDQQDLKVSPEQTVKTVSLDFQNSKVEPIEVVKLRDFEIKIESYDDLQLSATSDLKSSGVLGNKNLKVSDSPISSDAKASVKPQTVTKRSEENSLGIPQTGSKNGDKISFGTTQVKSEPSAKRSLDIVTIVKSEQIVVTSTKYKVMKTSSKIVDNVLDKVSVSEKQGKSSCQRISRRKGCVKIANMALVKKAVLDKQKRVPRQRISRRKRYVKTANKVLIKESVSGKQVTHSRQRYLFRKGNVRLANQGLCRSTVSDKNLKCSRQKLFVRKAYAKIVGRKPFVAKIKVLFWHKEEMMLFRDTELSWHYKVHRQKYKRIFILLICKNGGHSAYKLM